MNNFEIAKKLSEMQTSLMNEANNTSPVDMPPWLRPLFEKIEALEVKVEESMGRYMDKVTLCEHLKVTPPTLTKRLMLPRAPKPVMGKYLLSEVVAFLKSRSA